MSNKYLYDSDDLYPRRSNPIATIGIIVVAAAIGILILSVTLRQCAPIEPKPAIAVHTGKPDISSWRYESFFRRHNSPEPHRMAKAVLATKRPRVMAAIAVVESNGDHSAIGDNGHARGAFQVWSHWGEVHPDPVRQALQAERILEELIGEAPGRSLRQALSAYNTGRYHSRAGRRYAQRVIKLTKELRV